MMLRRRAAGYDRGRSSREGNDEKNHGRCSRGRRGRVLRRHCLGRPDAGSCEGAAEGCASENRQGDGEGVQVRSELEVREARSRGVQGPERRRAQARLPDQRPQDEAAVARAVEHVEGHVLAQGQLSVQVHRRGPRQARNEGRVRGQLSGAREGGCACGAVRYRLASEPLFVHCCHCLNCQRQTGSAFVVNVLIEGDRVELVAGEPQPVAVPRDDGSAQTIYRCPDCQIAVYSEYGGRAVVFVRAGTLDDPKGVTPDVHIYTKSKVGWVVIPDAAPAFDEYYDSKTLWPADRLARLRAVLPSRG